MSETAMPKLTEGEKTVLRAVLERKLVRGGELLRYSVFRTPDDLIEPVRGLLNARLLEASGLGAELTPDTVLFATFSSRPSLEKYLRELTSW